MARKTHPDFTRGMKEQRTAIPLLLQRWPAHGHHGRQDARTIASHAKSNVIGLADRRAAREIFHEARLDGDGLLELTAAGHDPCHAAYIYGQNIASDLAEQLSAMKEATIRQDRRRGRTEGTGQKPKAGTVPVSSELAG